jgi:hypothetical protein
MMVVSVAEVIRMTLDSAEAERSNEPAHSSENRYSWTRVGYETFDTRCTERERIY